MKSPIVAISLLALLSCKSESTIIRQEPRAIPAPANAFIETRAGILANSAEIRLQPELYDQVKYRVDKAFHQFEEKKVVAGTIMTLRNISGLPQQPLRFWIGEVEVVATEQIQVFFDSQFKGVLLDAAGEVVWKKGDELVRATRVRVRDGQVEFTGRK